MGGGWHVSFGIGAFPFMFFANVSVKYHIVKIAFIICSLHYTVCLVNPLSCITHHFIILLCLMQTILLIKKGALVMNELIICPCILLTPGKVPQCVYSTLIIMGAMYPTLLFYFIMPCNFTCQRKSLAHYSNGLKSISYTYYLISECCWIWAG